MLSFCTKISFGARKSFRVSRIAALLLCVFLSTGILFAQSTAGSFIGTVKDPSGSVVAEAKVTLTNQETAAIVTSTSNKSGQYEFLNVPPGNYTIEIDAVGFTKLSVTKLTLLSRDTQRVDGLLTVGAANVSVTVQATAAVINTDTPNIAQTRTGVELTTLPIAISSIQGGSTSPYSTLQTQAGVTVDSSGNLNVAGSTPAMMNVSVDGISTMNVNTANVATEMFPSFNTIEEIRVSQNANAAEFGGTTDITTVSKGGNNNPHGGVFDNYQSKGFNSNSPFTPTNKANLVLNDFGGFYGGPIVVPWLYNGHDKTFYFLSYEGLRLPQQTSAVLSVPTLAERNGDFSAFPKQLYHADGVTPWAGNQIPVSQWSSTSAYLLNKYYPLPNYGAAGAINNNYNTNIATPITSDQGDGRIDQKITSKQSVYARYSYKQRSVQTLLNSGLGGTISQPEKDTTVTGSYNYVLTPSLLNEFRAGLSKYITASSFNSNSSVIAEAGIQGIPDLLPTSVAAEPGLTVTGLTSISGGSSARSSNTYQFTDSLTWVHGKHTIKTGADYRRLYAFSSNVFSTTRLGRYSFTGTSTVGLKMINGNGTGSQVAQFVQGIPDTTTVTDVSQPNQNGRGNGYAFFIQDDFKITNSLTLSYGLRYEYHPPFTDKYDNSANFLTDYISTQNGATVRGAVVVPSQYALANNVLPAFASSVSPYPILTAAQAGEPSQLTRPTKTDFAPRFGFAWRPLHNDKTVVRGGLGHFIVPVLGQEINAGWAVSASAVANYTNTYKSGTTTPVIAFPTPFATTPNAAAALYFDLGQTTHYKDPTMEQWNLTLEQAIGFKTGLRATYMGNHAQKLNGTPNINQIPYHAVPAGGATPAQSQQPYPYLGEITAIENVVQTNYNALTLEANHRMTSGLQFQTSYTFARNLSNNTITNWYNLLQDYGNVPNSTRRHRYLASAVYNLPFGHNQAFLGNTNYFLDKAVANWSLSGFFVAQSGAFVTPVQASSQGDPTGTANNAGYGAASAIRADVVPGVSPYAGKGLGARNRLNYLVGGNVAAYQPVMASATAAAPGRQGTAAVGSLVGNGANSLSMTLMKGFSFTERAKLDFGVQVQNLLNHHNYADPTTFSIGTPATFGVSTAMQTAGDLGMRSMMLTGRLSF
jgi:hypothetical protein